jgi:hypothetical protein
MPKIKNSFRPALPGHKSNPCACFSVSTHYILFYLINILLDLLAIKMIVFQFPVRFQAQVCGKVNIDDSNGIQMASPSIDNRTVQADSIRPNAAIKHPSPENPAFVAP